MVGSNQKKIKKYYKKYGLKLTNKKQFNKLINFVSFLRLLHFWTSVLNKKSNWFNLLDKIPNMEILQPRYPSLLEIIYANILFPISKYLNQSNSFMWIVITLPLLMQSMIYCLINSQKSLNFNKLVIRILTLCQKWRKWNKNQK